MILDWGWLPLLTFTLGVLLGRHLERRWWKRWLRGVEQAKESVTRATEGLLRTFAGPDPKPAPPLMRIMREGCLLLCPKCGSTMTRRFMLFGAKTCDQPLCENAARS